MKKLIMMTLLLFGLVGLTACNDDDDDKSQQQSTYEPGKNTSSEDDGDEEGSDDDGENGDDDSEGGSGDDDKDDEEETDTSGTDDSTTPNIVECEAEPNPIQAFVRVQTSYGLMFGQAHIYGETGGLLPLTLTHPAAAGDLTLQLDSTVSLVEGQLITYHADNLDYYAARIKHIDGNTVTLDERSPVVSGISVGQKLWNFYDNPTHPNASGFKAIADFAYRTTADLINSDPSSNTKHVLLGDSWFDMPGFHFQERLALRYPHANIVNKGIGGNTLCNLLARFDTDVAPEAPQYVWINSSINDYYDDVTQEQYKARLQDLISKVQAIGATAIVFDPAPLNNGATTDGIEFQTLFMRYATQVSDLFDEAQHGTSGE
ncbi:MAG: hypothetical protein CSB47_03085 [Proteobacteria bacterium]|nr:MAG: hypothetical protein CSB47_03085 [Pseudomonadota bacterium]